MAKVQFRVPRAPLVPVAHPFVSSLSPRAAPRRLSPSVSVPAQSQAPTILATILTTRKPNPKPRLRPSPPLRPLRLPQPSPLLLVRSQLQARSPQPRLPRSQLPARSPQPRPLPPPLRPRRRPRARLKLRPRTSPGRPPRPRRIIPPSPTPLSTRVSSTRTVPPLLRLMRPSPISPRPPPTPTLVPRLPPRPPRRARLSVIRAAPPSPASSWLSSPLLASFKRRN